MQHESRSNAPLETVRTEEKQAYVKDITESKVQGQGKNRLICLRTAHVYKSEQSKFACCCCFMSKMKSQRPRENCFYIFVHRGEIQCVCVQNVYE